MRAGRKRVGRQVARARNQRGVVPMRPTHAPGKHSNARSKIARYTAYSEPTMHSSKINNPGARSSTSVANKLCVYNYVLIHDDYTVCI